jgi:hypothetical protein
VERKGGNGGARRSVEIDSSMPGVKGRRKKAESRKQEAESRQQKAVNGS